MAKAIVIKNADFSANKLDTVTFAVPVPCTGITLSQSTISMGIGTQTITATATPSNTTDTVVWSTTDATVATVSGGVITSVGIGSCTIKAKCGNYTAECSVSVSVSYDYDDINVLRCYCAVRDKAPTGALVTADSQNRSAIVGYPTDETSESYYVCDFTNISESQYFYGIPIPGGATSISVSGFNDLRCVLLTFDSHDYSPNFSDAQRIKEIVGDNSYYSTRSFDIDTSLGADVFLITLQTSGSNITGIDLSGLTISFS